MPVNESVAALNLDEYKYGFRDEENYIFKSRKGLDEAIVREISSRKNEPTGRRAGRGRRPRDQQPKERAAVDAGRAAQGAEARAEAALAHLGRRPERAELRRHLLLHPPQREDRAHVGRGA